MIYEFQCLEGHKTEIWCRAGDKYCQTVLCECGHSMAPLISSFRVNVYFEESRPRRIQNLNTLDEKGNEVPCPELKSWKDYERQKKKAGVIEAGNRMGEKGVWF